MPFVIKPPPIPVNTEKGIGIFIHKSYDSRNIKVFQDIAQSVIMTNPLAKFIILGEDEKYREWAKDYLDIHNVPEENRKFIPELEVKPIFNIKPKEKKKDKPEPIFKKAFNSKKAEALSLYKESIGTYNLHSVYIFTDSPKALEVVEVIKGSKLYDYYVYTITCDGDYTDHTYKNNPKNHKAYYGGIYRNEHLRKD